MNTNLRSSFCFQLSFAAFAAALLLGANRPARAQYAFFAHNATINTALGSGGQDTAIVGYANSSNWTSRANGASPTITVTAGASFAGMLTYNSSIVNMSGGTFGNLVTDDHSTVNLNGGLYGNIIANAESTININGGGSTASHAGYLSATYGGTVNVNGGAIAGNVGTAAGGTMNVHGGTFASGQITVGLTRDDAGNWATGASTLNVYGSLPHAIQIGPHEWIRVPGHTVTATLVTSNASYMEYALQGELGDGTNVTGLKVIVLAGNTFNVTW